MSRARRVAGGLWLHVDDNGNVFLDHSEQQTDSLFMVQAADVGDLVDELEHVFNERAPSPPAVVAGGCKRIELGPDVVADVAIVEAAGGYSLTADVGGNAISLDLLTSGSAELGWLVDEHALLECVAGALVAGFSARPAAALPALDAAELLELTAVVAHAADRVHTLRTRTAPGELPSGLELGAIGATLRRALVLLGVVEQQEVNRGGN